MIPRTTSRGAAALPAAAGLLTAGLATASPAPAAPAQDGAEPAVTARGADDTPKHPLKIKAKRDAQKQAALQRKLEGKRAFARGKGQNQDVPLELEGTDRIFVVLAEFGEERYPDPRFADGATLAEPEPQAFDGPLHNEIPQPNRLKDNATLWQSDYDTDHYEDMYFNRMAEYYETQSSGRYSVEGDVTEWVRVPFNQALYGRDYCGDVVCASTKGLVRDALAVWVEDQLASGKTMTAIRRYLDTFDVQDRYDIDGDGNYEEPDGFIDHFQIVHAGGDEAAGDPTYGSDAIWSHRWYSNLQAGGPGGLTGVNIGSNAGALSSAKVPNNPTGVWVGDYTIQPENGGLGVFAHEYAHDLGLPDLYDTSGNTGGAENSTAFWTLMSSGANIGDGSRSGIGDDPTDMSSWELFQLGWLEEQNGKGPFYEVAGAGETSTFTLGKNAPASSGGAQSVFTVLPDKEVPLEIGEPASGDQQFWSTQGDDLNTTMTKDGIEGTELTAQVNYQIEEFWDYAFLEASPGGGDWTPVETNLSVPPDDDESGFNESGTGLTGSTDDWTELTATLPADTESIRFRYQTDGAYVEQGFRVDDIAVDGTPIGTAETADEGWVFDGFVRTTGTEIQKFFNAYISENRQYDGYDESLKTAYNFGFGTTRPDWVETFAYEPGMLVWYWDDSQTDNNVGDHPGSGLLLPVDARPQFSHFKNGTIMRPRFLSADSTFGRKRSKKVTLHLNGKPATIPAKNAVPRFDDTRSYWSNSDQHASTGNHTGRYQPGWYSVDVPRTGTTITVLKVRGNGTMDIRVAPKRNQPTS